MSQAVHRMRRHPLLVFAAVTTLAAGAARADANLAGSWDVTALGSTVPFVFTQSGTNIFALSNNQFTWRGTIDPPSGVFSLAATSESIAIAMACGIIDATVAPDGNHFDGTFSTALLECSGLHPPICVCGPFTDSPVTGVRLTGPNVCGNSTVESGEQCDDGNTVAGDCCSPSCQFEAMGTPCAADASACTLDACDGAGQCEHGPYPACRAPSHGGALTVERTPPAGGRAQFLWKDDTGGTTAADFGDPTTMSRARLCVFSGATLILDASAPPAACGVPPCWTATPGGFVFKDPGSAPGGLGRVILRARANGRSRLYAKGSGAALSFLGDPTPPLRAQLHIEDLAGQRCWELP